MKVYGPYLRKDGRKHVIVYPAGNAKKGNPKHTVSYPKWLMEQHLGRKLEPHETVDHINRDKTDDRIENLRVIDKSQHSREDSPRVKLIEIECLWCGKNSLKEPRYLRANAKQGKAGPFCGRSCGAKYGREVQLKRIEPLPTQPSVKSEYYYIEKK